MILEEVFLCLPCTFVQDLADICTAADQRIYSFTRTIDSNVTKVRAVCFYSNMTRF